MVSQFINLWDFVVMASGYASDRESRCVGIWRVWSAAPNDNLVTYDFIRLKTAAELMSL